MRACSTPIAVLVSSLWLVLKPSCSNAESCLHIANTYIANTCCLSLCCLSVHVVLLVSHEQYAANLRNIHTKHRGSYSHLCFYQMPVTLLGCVLTSISWVRADSYRRSGCKKVSCTHRYTDWAKAGLLCEVDVQSRNPALCRSAAWRICPEHAMAVLQAKRTQLPSDNWHTAPLNLHVRMFMLLQ